MVDGTSTGTTSATNGRFTIAAPANGTLIVSFIGYETQKVAIAGKTTVNVTLAEDTQAIDDVVVVAFGTAKKEAFTGSAGVIKTGDIVGAQTSNPLNALQGKIAGVQVSTNSGQPGVGAEPQIRIRGFSSISAGQSPLIILDGIPYDGNMNSINSSDIESMTVLKDAASNALYGARGANGVIMITTKKGKSGDAKVEVDIKLGVNQRGIQSYDYITSPAEFYETHYQSLYNYYLSQDAYNTPAKAHEQANQNMISGATGLGYQVYNVPAGQDFIGMDGKVNPNATLGNVQNGNLLTPDNWTDEAFKNSLRQEYNVSVSGGTERAQIYASFGYLNNKGIIDKSDFERYTARLKADFQAKKWLKIGGNVGYTNYAGNSTGEDGKPTSTGNVFAYTKSIAPIYPLYVRDAQGNIMTDANGYTIYDYGKGENGGAKRGFNGNAIADNLLNTSEYTGNAFNANGYFDVKFLKDFTFTFNAGTNLDERRLTDIANQFYGASAASGGAVYKTHTRRFGINLQQLLNYTKTINDVHTISAMIGHESYKYRYSYLTANKKKLFSPDNKELTGAVIAGSADSYTADYNTEGYFGRVQYDYKEKIFVSGSYRRDASSSFHPDNRWGNFWSLGAAWLISKEPFMEGSRDWLDMLKIKASYGTQGNDNLVASRRYNLYTDLYSIVNSNDEVAVVFDTKGNKDITWEKNGNFNAGVEFGLLNNRITGSVEYYLRKTSDMLFYFSVPASLGYAGYYSNIGNMNNKGAEIDLNFTPIHTKKVQWDINVNATWLSNKITMLPAEKKTQITDYEGVAGYSTSEWFIGQDIPLYSWYVPKYAGVDAKTGLSTWYTYDKETGETSTTTVYNEATKYICGSALPDMYGGFGTTVNFYGFDFGIQFTYQIGGKGYDGGYASSMYVPSGSNGNNWNRDILKAWTPENTNTDVPRLQYADQYTNTWSDRFLTDASYLSLQNITFGYTLPKEWTRKISVDRVRIYLACENVWFWSKRKGYDPRGLFATTQMADIGQVDGAYYSPIRTISGGISLTF